MLSQKARYALRAMLHLAVQPKGEPQQIAEIAEASNVPRKFLEQILLELKKRGLVHSLRGRSGGYQLGRETKDISFAERLLNRRAARAQPLCQSHGLSPLRRLHRRGNLRHS